RDERNSDRTPEKRNRGARSVNLGHCSVPMGPAVGGAAFGLQGEAQASAGCPERQMWSAGGRPAGVRARRPTAWMAGGRETELLKPIDEAIVRMVSESPGRNESERRGSLENAVYPEAEQVPSWRRPQSPSQSG